MFNNHHSSYQAVYITCLSHPHRLSVTAEYLLGDFARFDVVAAVWLKIPLFWNAVLCHWAIGSFIVKVQ
jgi:hypothetical protein